MTTIIHAIFEADYYGSQKHCYLYNNDNKYCDNNGIYDEIEEFIIDYVEENIVDDIKLPNSKNWYWVLKPDKTITGSVNYKDFLITYDLKKAVMLC